MRLFFIVICVAAIFTANAIPPGGDTNATYLGPDGFFQKFTPTGNAVSGQDPWLFASTVAVQGTNDYNQFTWGINIDKNGQVVNTNRHALGWNAEQGYDADYPYGLNQMEFYMFFQSRSNGPGVRADFWSFSTNEIQNLKGVNVFSLRHPRLPATPVASWTQSPALDGSGDYSQRGTINILPTSLTAATLNMYGGTYGAVINLGNAGQTKLLSLYGSSEDGAGFDGHAVIKAGTDLLRISAAQTVYFPGNTFFFGPSNVFNGPLYIFNSGGLSNLNSLIQDLQARIAALEQR